MKTNRMRIGISSCLLGREVRWNGTHKRNAWLVDTLGRFVEWVAVCPEADMGLTVPREPMNLVKINGKIHLVANTSKTDHSSTMRSFSSGRIAELGNICGYVLKSRSPSCGAAGVRVLNSGGQVHRNGRGLFAEVLLSRFPYLPVEEESGLANPGKCEHFIRRIFTWCRWQTLVSSGATPQKIQCFHDRHRYLIMAHNRALCEHLERFADAEDYFFLLFQALQHAPSTRNHAHVLSCIVGQLGCRSHEAKSINKKIEEYRRGELPFMAPLELVRRYANNTTALRDQVYLYPDTDEWELLREVLAIGHHS